MSAKLTSSQKTTIWIASIVTAVNWLGWGFLVVNTGGGCPHFPGWKGFDVEKYKGTWYELQRDKDIMFEEGDCITAEYGDDGKYVSVKNTQRVNDKPDVINGYAYANTWYPGWVNVVFGGGFGADYRVEASDFDNYAIVYSCTSFASIKLIEFVWLLGRNPLVENSADWKALQKTVDPLFKKLLPEYDRSTRFQVTKQGGSCKYTATEPRRK